MMVYCDAVRPCMGNLTVDDPAVCGPVKIHSGIRIFRVADNPILRKLILRQTIRVLERQSVKGDIFDNVFKAFVYTVPFQPDNFIGFRCKNIIFINGAFIFRPIIYFTLFAVDAPLSRLIQIFQGINNIIISFSGSKVIRPEIRRDLRLEVCRSVFGVNICYHRNTVPIHYW